jgi:hypothetical protein
MGSAAHSAVAADLIQQSEVHKGAVNHDFTTHPRLPTIHAGLHKLG